MPKRCSRALSFSGSCDRNVLRERPDERVRLTTSAAGPADLGVCALAGFGLEGSTSLIPKRAARALRFSSSSSAAVVAAAAGAAAWLVSLATGVALGGDA